MKITQAARDAAEGLSENQRGLVVQIGNAENGLINQAIRWRVLSALRRKGLCAGHAFGMTYLERLTPLGEEVKAHLTAIRSKS